MTRLRFSFVPCIAVVVCFSGCGSSKPAGNDAATAPRGVDSQPVASAPPAQEKSSSPPPSDTPPAANAKAVPEKQPAGTESKSPRVADAGGKPATKKPTAEVTVAPGPESAAKREETVEKPTVATPVEPATFTQLAEAIDLRKVPIPEDATFTERRLGTCYLVLSGDTRAATEFVRKHLKAQGCVELKPESPANPPYVSLAFGKGNFLASAFISPGTDPEKQTNVVLTCVGNVAPVSLAIPEGAERLRHDRSYSLAITADDIDAAEKATIDLFLQEGWREHTLDFEQTPEKDPKVRFPQFFKNGIQVLAYLSESTDVPGKTAIQYHCSVHSAELPLTTDADTVRFPMTPGVVKFNSEMEVPAIVEFYDTRFEELGWSQRKDGRVVRDRLARLLYAHDNDVTMVDVRPREKGYTLVLTGLVNKVPRDEERALARANQGRIDMENNGQDLPLPEGAKAAKYDRESKRVKFQSPLGIQELVDFYVKAFTDAGWKENEQNRAVEKTTGNFNAELNDDRVFVNFFKLDDKTPTEVTALAYGFKWNPVAEMLVEDPEEEQPSTKVAESDEAETDVAAEIAEAKEKAMAELEKATSELDGDLKNAVDDAIGAAFGKKAKGKAKGKNAGLPTEKSDPETTDPTAEPAATAPLTAKIEHDLPVLEDHTSSSFSGTPFFKEMDVTTGAALKPVVELYRKELKTLGWKETASAGNPIEQQVTFEKGTDRLKLKVNRKEDDETTIHLEVRLTAAAKEAGILPKPGTSVIMVGNPGDQGAKVTLGMKTVSVRAGEGAEKPNGPRFDVKPGKHKLIVKLADGTEQTETIEAEADQVWGVILLPEGPLAMRVY